MVRQVEETDTVVSLIVDLPRKHITTFMVRYGPNYRKALDNILNRTESLTGVLEWVSTHLSVFRKQITNIQPPISHWNNAEKAHGNKRDTSDFKRWRNLATERAGYPSERHVLPEQASIDLIFEGRGDLEDIELDAPTL